MRPHHTIYSLVLAVFLFASCKKFVQIPPSPLQIAGSDVFADDQSATSALTDIFLNMSASGSGFSSINMTRLGGMYTDEMTYTRPQAAFQQFEAGHLSNDNSSVAGTWQEIYTYIYQANSVIERLAGNKAVSPAVNRTLTAEALFVRAYCYFYLANLYGDVPLVLTTDYIRNQKLPRTPVATVNAQIVSDLKASIGGLGPDGGAGHRVLPSDWAARSLLARAYLYDGDFPNGFLYADSVIRSGLFPLASSLANVFLAGSPEAIWQLAPYSDAIADTWEGYSFAPTRATVIPQYVLNNYLMNAFEPGDKRKTTWTGVNTVSGAAYYYPYKYRSRQHTGTESHMVFRSAELYLIRAECAAQTQNTAGCIQDLNLLRSRAGLAPLADTTDAGFCLQAVMQERRVELFAENGHRFFDLVRTKTADAVLGPEKTNWTTDSKRWPVPLAELKTNPALVQNQGY
ncbi:MAG TPA: RagB/SusD family nutrient uptake outer membrane protein [Puia sp.]|nr:RagB/SusD family nutrient uptake outer membrane protein [Puia sp.]